MAVNAPRAKRQAVNRAAMIYASDGARIAPCRLRNISATGAQIELARETVLPKTFLLSLSESGTVLRRCAIVWQFSTVVGVKFALDDQLS
jgi:PilZ domain